MQAITVKYIGPTDTKPSRLVVRARAGRMILKWNTQREIAENYTIAANTFIKKLGLDWKISDFGVNHKNEGIFITKEAGE